jgi:hypothetical protein
MNDHARLAGIARVLVAALLFAPVSASAHHLSRSEKRKTVRIVKLDQRRRLVEGAYPA